MIEPRNEQYYFMHRRYITKYFRYKRCMVDGVQTMNNKIIYEHCIHVHRSRFQTQCMIKTVETNDQCELIDKTTAPTPPTRIHIIITLSYHAIAFIRYTFNILTQNVQSYKGGGASSPRLVFFSHQGGICWLPIHAYYVVWQYVYITGGTLGMRGGGVTAGKYNIITKEKINII